MEDDSQEDKDCLGEGIEEDPAAELVEAPFQEDLEWESEADTLEDHRNHRGLVAAAVVGSWEDSPVVADTDNLRVGAFPGQELVDNPASVYPNQVLGYQSMNTEVDFQCLVQRRNQRSYVPVPVYLLLSGENSERTGLRNDSR